jgi:hypothetical protein
MGFPSDSRFWSDAIEVIRRDVSVGRGNDYEHIRFFGDRFPGGNPEDRSRVQAGSFRELLPAFVVFN